jgi:hypothetical protein
MNLVWISAHLDWITNPLTFYAVLLIGGSACLHMVISIRIDLRRQHLRHRSETGTLQDALKDLRLRMEEQSLDTLGQPVPASPYPSGALNINKRAEALRMYRRGTDHHTIAAAVGLPQAEMELLRKVHQILAGQTDRSVVQ